MRFNVRREHPGGRLRGAAAGHAIVDDRDGNATRRKLARDRASDDARSDDEDWRVHVRRERTLTRTA